MQQEQVLFSLPLSRLEPIFKKWISDVIAESGLDSPSTHVNSVDTHLDIKSAAKYLAIAESTIYQNIRKIPHSKRFGKLYFLRSELDAFVAEGQSQIQTTSRNKSTTTKGLTSAR